MGTARRHGMSPNVTMLNWKTFHDLWWHLDGSTLSRLFQPLERSVSLRVLPSRCHQMSDPPCTFPSITLLLDHLSKICMILFWPSEQRCQKYVCIWKVSSGGRAEISKWSTLQNFAYFEFLNFSPATRGHFSNVNILLTAVATLSKKCYTDFLMLV